MKKKEKRNRKPAVLRPKSEGDPCISRVWDAWSARGYPGYQMPGMWEEVHSTNEHDPVRLKSHSGLVEKILWLWIASDAKTKVISVMQVGARNHEMAYSVVHELKGRLAASCVPVFSTDGLKNYFYALTAQFGKWGTGDGQKPVCKLLGEFVYEQVIKHQRRRRTVEVERRVLWDEERLYQERLKKPGARFRILGAQPDSQAGFLPGTGRFYR